MSEREHKCGTLPDHGLAVYRADQFFHNSAWDWCLVVQRLATEIDLEDNHYLETIGQSIWQTVVGISHCPFCGENLSGTSQSASPAKAEFYHLDSSGWRSEPQ
jgi:hypothetical protein